MRQELLLVKMKRRKQLKVRKEVAVVEQRGNLEPQPNHVSKEQLHNNMNESVRLSTKTFRADSNHGEGSMIVDNNGN